MRGFDRLLVLLVLSVTLNALLFMRINPDRIVPGTDSPQYDLMARQLAADRGFTLDEQPPYQPTVFREPGYPLLVAAMYAIAGPNPDSVAVLQSVLIGLTASCIALVGAWLFGPVAGLVGGAVFGLSSEVAHYGHWLLTEVLFTFVLVISLALALRAQREGRRRDYLATGIGFGLATLVRVIGGAVAAPIFIVLTFRGVRTRPQMLHLGLLLAGFAVVIAPWVARNWEATGQPALTSRFGVNLIRRAPRAAEPLSAYPAWIAASAWIATNPLSQLVYPINRFQWGPNYEDNVIWDFHVNEMVRYNRRYEPVCQPAPDPDACYSEIGLAFVRSYPIGYAVQSAFALATLLFTPLPGPQALVHNTLVWLGLGSVVGFTLRGRLKSGHLLILTAFGGYVLASIIVDTQVRYLVPMLPILAMFAAVPISRLIELAVHRTKFLSLRSRSPDSIS